MLKEVRNSEETLNASISWISCKQNNGGTYKIYVKYL